MHVPPERVDQDGEWCTVRVGARSEVVRFHDYGRIYRIPGLYERLFRDVLECRSPDFVTEILADRLEAANTAPDTLRCLDVGAGNGLVGASLRARGVRRIMGLDILEEAAMAAARDRPDVYERYLVADLTALPEAERSTVEAFAPNALTLVAALGFGDIPAEAFLAAWQLVCPDAWIALNIKERFLEPQRDESGFARLMRALIDGGHFVVEAKQRYVHRKATSDEPLHYVALVGRKRDVGPIPTV